LKKSSFLESLLHEHLVDICFNALYISCMNKEDIEQTVADLVEAIRTDAVIEVAKADYEFLSRQADDVHQAYDLAVVRAEDAHKQLLELQRHKRDVPALRERLLSLLAGGNISTETEENGDVKRYQRMAYAAYAHGVQYLRPSSDAVREDIEDILAGNQDGTIREWMHET
jgi:hypothetical protein